VAEADEQLRHLQNHTGISSNIPTHKW